MGKDRQRGALEPLSLQHETDKTDAKEKDLDVVLPMTVKVANISGREPSGAVSPAESGKQPPDSPRVESDKPTANSGAGARVAKKRGREEPSGTVSPAELGEQTPKSPRIASARTVDSMLAEASANSGAGADERFDVKLAQSEKAALHSFEMPTDDYSAHLVPLQLHGLKSIIEAISVSLKASDKVTLYSEGEISAGQFLKAYTESKKYFSLAFQVFEASFAKLYCLGKLQDPTSSFIEFEVERQQMIFYATTLINNASMRIETLNKFIDKYDKPSLTAFYQACTHAKQGRDRLIDHIERLKTLENDCKSDKFMEMISGKYESPLGRGEGLKYFEPFSKLLEAESDSKDSVGKEKNRTKMKKLFYDLKKCEFYALSNINKKVWLLQDCCLNSGKFILQGELKAFVEKLEAHRSLRAKILQCSFEGGALTKQPELGTEQQRILLDLQATLVVYPLLSQPDSQAILAAETPEQLWELHELNYGYGIKTVEQLDSAYDYMLSRESVSALREMRKEIKKMVAIAEVDLPGDAAASADSDAALRGLKPRFK